MLLGMLLPVAADEVVTETTDEVVTEVEEEGQLTMAVKAAWGLRLRETPGLRADTLLVLRCGEQVIVLDGLEEATIKNGYSWVQVSVTREDVTTTGYVALKYLTKNLKPSCYLWAPGPINEPGCKPPRPPRPPNGPLGGN
jgi:hypothetical protein